MMLPHDIELLLFLLLSLHGCDNIWISSSQLHLGKKHDACSPPPKTRMWMRSNVACNETNLMLHTCHQWTLLLQLPVGGGWWRSVCVLRSKIACPKLGKLNVVLRLAAAKRRAKSTKAAYRVVWARGTLSGDWVRFAVFGFGIALRARHNRFGKRMRNAGDIIGKHKLYEELHELFSCFPIFPFSYAG